MQDFALTFETETQAIAALPEYRAATEDGEQWAGAIIANATRWIQRPSYDEDGNVTTPAEKVPGWHCVVRAETNPAPDHHIAEPGDIEPIFAGGWKHPIVPESITPLQGELAIDQAGLSAAYEAWRDDPARTFSERAFINRAGVWKRDDPVLAAAGEALSLTEAQVDQLFITAATL